MKLRTATIGASLALCVLALQSALAVSVVYKSVDGGASWSPSYNGLVGPPEFLAVDPGNSANLYALAGGGGLYKSTDGGASWFGVRGFFGTLAISPSTPSILYADATSPRSDGILRSADGGLTWSTVSNPIPEPFRVLAIDPQNPDTVYAATGGDGSSGSGGRSDGLYKSTDGGVTWNAILAGRGTGIQALVVAPSASSTMYALNRLGGLTVTRDGGENWTASLFTGNSLFTPRSRALHGLVADPADSSIVYGLANGGFVKSTDAGMNFSQQGDLSDATLLTIDPTNTATFYAGTTVGVYKSTDGGDHWQAVDNGLPVANIQLLALAPTTPSTLYVSFSAQTLTLNPNPLVIPISGPGSTAGPITITASSSAGGTVTSMCPCLINSTGGNWLSSSGSTNGNTFTVSVGNTGTLSQNTSYNGTVSVSSNVGSGLLNVTLQVGSTSGGGNGVAASPSSLQFNTSTGGQVDAGERGSGLHACAVRFAAP